MVGQGGTAGRLTRVRIGDRLQTGRRSLKRIFLAPFSAAAKYHTFELRDLKFESFAFCALRACQEFCGVRSCEDMKKRNSHDRQDEERHTANSEQQNIYRLTDRPLAEPGTEQRCGVAVRRNWTGRSTEETVGGADAGG